MNKIYRYNLENIDQQTIEIPLPARILSVVEQNNDIVLYSIIDDGKDIPIIPVDVLIRGNEDFVEDNIEDNIGLYTFLGTVKLFDGKDIWHVFYKYAEHGRNIRTSDKLEEPIVEEFTRKYPGKGGMLVA